VFSAVLLLVAISFFMARNTVRQERQTAVTNYIEETESTMKERLNVFEVTLKAGLGLVSANPNITLDQWEKFVHNSAVLEHYPGSQNVNYAKVVSTADVPAFTANAQSRTVPEFHIYPVTQQSSYTPILFISPTTETNRQFYGFDITSDPVRKSATDKARDTGQVTVSGAVQSPIDKSKPSSFILYAPQYKSGMPLDTVPQRQQAIEGFAYVGFKIEPFISSISNTQKNSSIAFSIRNRDSNTELFHSADYDKMTKGTHRTQTSQVHIGATILDVTYAYNPNNLLPGYVSQRPTAIIIFGSLVAMLIAVTVWLVLASKANELLLDQERGINEAKDNLLSLASHQLRTPATGVKQYLGLILQGFAGDVSPRQQDILEKAYEGNERQLKTINDILYLARLGSGRIVLTKSYFPVRQVIYDVVNELSSDIKEKQHKVKIDVPKKERQFYGDEHMIRMAVDNMLTNAIKYTHKKGHITVTLHLNKELKICVEDDGVGIPDDQQENMFQQFARIDNELSITAGGTGIGLYVVKNIADLHQGHVEVTSKEGKGSKFTLVLPYLTDGKSNET
jgi:signal transduction histidine kinase